MEWVKLRTLFDSKEKALKTASIITTTESRLVNQQHGPRYEIETRLEQVGNKWRVSWRKVFVGYKSGCGGGCKTCGQIPNKKTGGKIIPFRKPNV